VTVASRRLARRRERGLLVGLDAYREAINAARFLRGCLHDPAWLKEVTVRIGEHGDVRVLVVLAWTTPLIERCLPQSVNKVPVTIAVQVER
jgi:hypothetical protein